MKEKYYFSKNIRTVILLIPVIIFLPSVLLFLQLDLPVSFLVLVAILGLPIVIIIRKFNKPAIETIDTGIVLYAQPLIKDIFISWDEIEGLATSKTKRGEVLKIYKKNEGKRLTLFNIDLKTLEKPKDLYEQLRRKIPLKKSADFRHLNVFKEPLTKQEMQHKQWTLSESGILNSGKIIPWDSVKEISCTIAPGLPYIVVTHERNNSQIENTTINPPFSSSSKNTSGYHEFIRYLIEHSPDANIDPGLVQNLNTPPGQASSDQLCIFLLLCGFAFSGIVSFVLMFYSPFSEITTRSIFTIIILMCCMAPCVRAFFMLVSQSRGEKILVSQKIKWSLYSIITPPLLFLLFCLVVPFTSSYMLGDIYFKAGDLDQSEQYYQKALVKSPGNIDVLFEIGVLYNEKGNHELAFDYLTEAYLKDPSYWLAEAAVFIPDTLIKMNRYQEALTWCNDILKEHSSEKSFEKQIGKKKKQIEDLIEKEKV
jgi:tetratricopeptide (TPR) repeat protein